MINTSIKTVDVHFLKNKMDSSKAVCLIDVREPEEWNTLRISGALHIPLAMLTSHIESHIADKSCPIYIQCRGGIRSLDAAQQLLKLGYEEVYSVDGGIMDWAANGYPVIN